DAATGVTRGVPLRHTGGYGGTYFSPDSTRIVTSGSDQAVRVWDAVTGRLLFSPLQGAEASGNAPVSPDGRFVLTIGADRVVRLWDLVGGGPNRLGLPHAGNVSEASFSPDGRMLATSEGGKVRFWDAVTGIPLGAPLTHPASRLASCRFSP